MSTHALVAPLTAPIRGISSLSLLAIGRAAAVTMAVLTILLLLVSIWQLVHIVQETATVQQLEQKKQQLSRLNGELHAKAAQNGMSNNSAQYFRERSFTGIDDITFIKRAGARVASRK